MVLEASTSHVGRSRSPSRHSRGLQAQGRTGTSSYSSGISIPAVFEQGALLGSHFHGASAHSMHTKLGLDKPPSSLQHPFETEFLTSLFCIIPPSQTGFPFPSSPNPSLCPPAEPRAVFSSLWILFAEDTKHAALISLFNTQLSYSSFLVFCCGFFNPVKKKSKWRQAAFPSWMWKTNEEPAAPRSHVVAALK